MGAVLTHIQQPRPSWRSDESILTIAFGVTRVFEYEMPDHVVRKHGHLDDPNAKAALNVRPSESVDSFANGVVIKVGAKDLPALRVREAGYDLIPVPCVPWSDRDAEPVIALTLSCPVESADGIPHVRDDLNPNGPYLKNCLLAAARLRRVSGNVSPDYLFHCPGLEVGTLGRVPCWESRSSIAEPMAGACSSTWRRRQ